MKASENLQRGHKKAIEREKEREGGETDGKIEFERGGGRTGGEGV